MPRLVARKESFLYELPEDLLLACIDHSLRAAIVLAMTNILLGARLRHAARDGLRLSCKFDSHASECVYSVKTCVLEYCIIRQIPSQMEYMEYVFNS